MLTLGINHGSHDLAAAIASGGKIAFAIAEERLRLVLQPSHAQ